MTFCFTDVSSERLVSVDTRVYVCPRTRVLAAKMNGFLCSLPEIKVEEMVF